VFIVLVGSDLMVVLTAPLLARDSSVYTVSSVGRAQGKGLGSWYLTDESWASPAMMSYILADSSNSAATSTAPSIPSSGCGDHGWMESFQPLE
jgi:hypothetical protein